MHVFFSPFIIKLFSFLICKHKHKHKQNIKLRHNMAHHYNRFSSTSNSNINSNSSSRSLSVGGAAANSQNKKDIGICAMEVYFPKTYVSQEDLEKADGVPKGKYTIGLGQTAMAFTGDQEDINSISLTVVTSLMEKYNISPHEIGRLEVGTETFVDKSKSTKTILMDLFAGNEDIEGATVVNACYGGTAALFNAIQWVESSSWDGRYALVVAGDIAVYAEGPARPTGGCGAVALLIGPNASIKVDLTTRSTFAVNAWDFFKPNLNSEYPEVAGALSNSIYLKSLDSCYQRFVDRQKKIANVDKSINNIDFALFHSPYNKLVQKSLSRLLFLDSLRGSLSNATGLDKFKSIPLDQTFDNKEIDVALKAISAVTYNAKVSDSAELSKQIGNTYTAALYMNLASLVGKLGNQFANKQALMFSYGSGSIASMFEVQGIERSLLSASSSTSFSPSSKQAARFTLDTIKNNLDIDNRLKSREKLSPEELKRALKAREGAHAGQKAVFKPTYSPDSLFPGTFYLGEVNSDYERIYKRSSGGSNRFPRLISGILRAMK